LPISHARYLGAVRAGWEQAEAQAHGQNGISGVSWRQGQRQLGWRCLPKRSYRPRMGGQQRGILDLRALKTHTGGLFSAMAAGFGERSERNGSTRRPRKTQHGLNAATPAGTATGPLWPRPACDQPLSGAGKSSAVASVTHDSPPACASQAGKVTSCGERFETTNGRPGALGAAVARFDAWRASGHGGALLV
jgi:hypothetical protein